MQIVIILLVIGAKQIVVSLLGFICHHSINHNGRFSLGYNQLVKLYEQKLIIDTFDIVEQNTIIDY